MKQFDKRFPMRWTEDRHAAIKAAAAESRTTIEKYVDAAIDAYMAMPPPVWCAGIYEFAIPILDVLTDEQIGAVIRAQVAAHRGETYEPLTGMCAALYEMQSAANQN